MAYNIFWFGNELCRYFPRWELEGFYIQVIYNKSKCLYQEIAQISSAYLMFMYPLFTHLKQPPVEAEGLRKIPLQ